MRIKHRFVEVIPEELENHTLYVSIKYNTVIHKCPCGCGEEVVTPLSPYDWKLIYDGETISLHPSIGNWNYSCRSHYWIKNSMIQWAGDMPKNEILFNRLQNQTIKKNAFKRKDNYFHKFLKLFIKYLGGLLMFFL